MEFSETNNREMIKPLQAWQLYCDNISNITKWSRNDPFLILNQSGKPKITVFLNLTPFYYMNITITVLLPNINHKYH
jgi:hypothetical protein